MTESSPYQDPFKPRLIDPADLPQPSAIPPAETPVETEEVVGPEAEPEQVAKRGLFAAVRESMAARKHRNLAFKEANRRSRNQAHNRIVYGDTIGTDEHVHKYRGMDAVFHPLYAKQERGAQRRSHQSRQLTGTLRSQPVEGRIVRKVFSLDSDEARALQSPKPFDTDRHLSKVTPYVDASIEREVKKKKLELGLAANASLPEGEAEAIKDKYRRFYLEMYFDSKDDFSEWQKNAIRERYGLGEKKKNGKNGRGKGNNPSPGSEDEPHSGDRSSGRARTARPIRSNRHDRDNSAKPAIPDWVKNNINTARDLGIFIQTDTLVTQLRISDNALRTERIDEMRADGTLPSNGKLPEEERREVFHRSRVGVARAHLDQLIYNHAINYYDDDMVEHMARAIAAARELDDLGYAPSDVEQP